MMVLPLLSRILLLFRVGVHRVAIGIVFYDVVVDVWIGIVGVNGVGVVVVVDVTFAVFVDVYDVGVWRCR